MLKRLLFAGLALYLLGADARAQTSSYTSMTVAGEWQGFNPGENNLILVSNQQWEGVFFISQRATNKFKFAANGNWTMNWGVGLTNSAPMTGTASVVSGPDIVLTNVVEGFYRFQFHEGTKAFAVDYLAPAYGGESGTNLIRNGDFSLADGVYSNEALNWNYRPALVYGDNYGNSGRVDWRGRSVPWQFFIGGTYGGLWQDVPAGSDMDYETTAWFWMDGTSNTNFGPWTSVVQEVKMEFYSATRGSPIAVVSTNIPFTPEDWFPVTLRAAAPTNAAWARTVINVSGGGPKGTLQIDDITLRALPRPYQYFSAWNFSVTGTLARGGWVASNAYVLANLTTNPNPLIYASPSLAIRPGGSLSSPRIEDGISRLQFRHRAGFEGDEDLYTNDLTEVAIEFSPDGTSFFSTTTLTVTALSYLPYGLNVNDPAQKYFRIRATAGTNAYLLDNIEIVPITPDSRFQDFSAWTSNAYTNAGCHTNVDSWTLCTGRVFSAGAYDAPSALLPGSSNAANYLKSPLFTNGYGTLSFQLARGNNGAAPGLLALQESVNGSTWTNIAVLSNLTDTAWTPYSLYFYQSQARYLRLLNTSTSTPSGGGSILLINEGFPTAPSAPEGWTFNGLSAYTSGEYTGQDPNSLKFDTTGDYAETPVLTGPTNVSFWMRGASINTGSVFTVQAFVGGNWQTAQLYTAISNSEQTYNVPVNSNATRVRFFYTTKVSGNVALDDVVVRGAVAGGQPPQDLLVDDISVGLPEEFRTQNFNSWPPKSQYAAGVHQFQGWTITNAIVNGDNAYDGQSLRLNSDLNNFVRTVTFPEGIGLITFQYAKWGSDTSPTLAIQYSTNDGAAWTTITNLFANNPSSNGYLRFEYLLNTNVPTAFRILHLSGSGRALLDDIELGKPQPPADVTVLGFHLPEAPFTNDTISLRAVVSPVYGATVTNMTAYYRVGTSGAFTALGMILTNFTSYQSLTNLGPHTTGTVVQYFIRAQFTGPGAVSPKYYPAGGSNDPAFYAIPRNQSGQVWINEVRYMSLGYLEFWGDTNLTDFIELAGPAGFNIGGWRIEVVNQVPTTNGLVADLVQNRYTLPPGSALNSNALPFGFYVAAMSEIAGANYGLSNYLGLVLPMGIRLYNEGGGLEQALSFGANMNGFVQVPADDSDFDSPYSVRLTGNGTNYADFTWANGDGWSPNDANPGQWSSEPPEAWITRMIWGTNVTIVSEGNTNNWIVTPWYATSVSNNATWSAITPFNISTNGGGTNTVSFDRPSQTNWFLRLLYTQP